MTFFIIEHLYGHLCEVTSDFKTFCQVTKIESNTTRLVWIMYDSQNDPKIIFPCSSRYLFASLLDDFSSFKISSNLISTERSISPISSFCIRH